MQRKAQQLVEFAIAVPILMMILFIIIEFGSALNTRVTVAEGVKTALVKVNNLSSLDGNTAAKEAFVETFVKNEMIRYLIQHNIPNSASVSVSVNAKGDSAVLLVKYNYNPYFLVPGLLGGVVPDSIEFSSSQSLNPHIFKDNVFPFPGFSRNTWELANFHTNGVGAFVDSGALESKDPHPPLNAYNVRENTAILLHFYGGIGTHPNLEYDYGRLVGWEGDELLPPNLRINIKTGTLETRSPYYQAGVWFDTKIPFIWVVSALGINHVIYTKYNSFEMLLADDSNLYYKLRFSDIADSFYNRKILWCTHPGNCGTDLRGTATVNERALRGNPRLGAVANNIDSGNNDYITGIVEPITIPSDPTHHFQDINGVYFSYTDDYVNWNRANWSNEYFITLSLPLVEGLNAGLPMADAIYHADMNDNTKNPFYKPYEYRLKFCEVLNGLACTQGEFLGLAPFAEDGNIDGNNFGGAAGWDASEPMGWAGDAEYTMDIVDIYIDSDGDGITDAWDRDPAFPDVNVNGILDGNETDDTVFNTHNDRCNDAIGPPHMYEADTDVICTELPVNLTVDQWYDYDGDTIDDYKVLAGDFTAFEASPGKPYYESAPYKIDLGTNTWVINGLESGTNVPDIRPSRLVLYTGDGHNALYYNLGGGKYTRMHKTWWDNFCGDNGMGNFSVCNMTRRRDIKTGVIGGTKFVHGTINVNDIDLDSSDELQYLLNQNVFSPNSYVTRTPPVVW